MVRSLPGLKRVSRCVFVCDRFLVREGKYSFYLMGLRGRANSNTRSRLSRRASPELGARRLGFYAEGIRRSGKVLREDSKREREREKYVCVYSSKVVPPVKRF